MKLRQSILHFRLQRTSFMRHEACFLLASAYSLFAGEPSGMAYLHRVMHMILLHMCHANNHTMFMNHALSVSRTVLPLEWFFSILIVLFIRHKRNRHSSTSTTHEPGNMTSAAVQTVIAAGAPANQRGDNDDYGIETQSVGEYGSNGRRFDLLRLRGQSGDR